MNDVANEIYKSTGAKKTIDRDAYVSTTRVWRHSYVSDVPYVGCARRPNKFQPRLRELDLS